MEHTTIRRNGGWTIELAEPLGGLNKIDLGPVSLDHTIRWSRHEIPSVLALIAELSGVKETQLKKLSGNDSDRLFIAFSFLAPGTIKKDFEQGARPLATPLEAMSEEERYEEVAQNDEQDPRFPKVDGPVQRFKEPPLPVEQQQPEQRADGGLNIAPPDVLKKVG